MMDIDGNIVSGVDHHHSILLKTMQEHLWRKHLR
jgi:hypothetical protein